MSIISGGSKGWPAVPPLKMVARQQGYIIPVFTAWHRNDRI